MTTGAESASRKLEATPRLTVSGDLTSPPRSDTAAPALAWLRNYRPNGVDTKTWRSVCGFVTECGETLVGTGVGEEALPRYVRALTKLACFCLETNQSLQINTALDPYTVNQFAEAAAKIDPASAGTYQSQLRFVGERLLPKAPWERPAPVSRRAVPTPYTPDNLTQLEHNIAKNTPERRRGGEALMRLGLGAGLDGRWAAKVEKEDVLEESEGDLSVRVDGRLVPVLHVHADPLRILRDDTPPRGLIVGGNARHKNAASEIASRLSLPSACPRLVTGRLRSTWIVTHLTMGTRLPELAEAAGTVGVTTFSDLLEFVLPLSADPDEAAQAARDMLRGPR